jgi:Interferon-induced transmembrane protein
MQSTGQEIFGQQSPAQAPVSGYQSPAEAVKSNLWMAIVSMLLFTPLGIAALINSFRVESRLTAGDIAGAVKASTLVRKLFIISIAVCAVVLLFTIIVALASSGSGGDTYAY